MKRMVNSRNFRIRFSNSSGRCRILLWTVFVFSLPISGFAQVNIVKGNRAPDKFLNADWYLDTVGHYCWHRKNGAFPLRSSFSDVNNIQDFEGAVALKISNTTYLMSYSGIHLHSATEVRRLEDVTMLMLGEYSQFFYKDSTFLGRNWKRRQSDIGDQQIVNGVAVFCATIFPEVYGIPLTQDVHGWGMLGTDGKWLIEPKFDAAFRFQNGFADVIYYGQRRKINEKGEFVE